MKRLGTAGLIASMLVKVWAGLLVGPFPLSPRRLRTNLSQATGSNWMFCVQSGGTQVFIAPKNTSELVTVLRLMLPGSR